MKREEQRVLAGSLNVLPPTDKTPEDDAIDLLNFRVDQSGVLRSAETFQSLGNIASGDPIHTLFPLSNLGTTLYANGGGSYDVQFAPETFLIGVGTSLYLFSPFSNGGAALLLASGFDGQPLGIVVWNGFIWVMNRFQQLVLYPPALTGQNTQAPMVGDWLPGAPTAGPHVDTTGIVYNEPPADATTGPVGTYQYYVTFVAMTGLETNPGPASQSITTNPGAPSEVILTQLPISPDPTVFARRIYRTGGTLGQAYQIAQISDNATVNGWVDWLSDLQVTELGIVMPTTNDPPPAALGVVGPYLNRLLAFNGTFDVNRAYWSQEGVPLFPGSQVTASTGNWVNVGSPDDPLYGITIHSRLAVFYKQRSIWRLQGDPDTGVLEQASATTGTVGPRAMANAGNVDYFVSIDGLFLFDLDLEHKVSQKLQPTFFSAFGWVQLGAVDLQIAAWNPYAVVCAWLNGTVLISDGYPAFLRAPGTAFLYHAETARWGRFATNFGAAITAVATLGSALYYYAGDASGNLLVSPAGNPGASNLAWQTRFLDQSLGDQPKRYVELVVDADLGGAGLTLFAFYDNGASRLPKASALIAQGVTGSGRQKLHFTLGDDGVLATNISVRIEIPNWLANPFASSGAAIYALYIYYYVEPRQTVEMLTRPFSLNPNLNTFQPRDANNVYQVKELGYDATLTGETTSQLLTDLPGNQLAVRQTDELQAVPGRRNFQLPQTQSATGYWTGRLFQVELSGTLFQLYNARILARKVGVYIEDYEALAGFLWDSWYLNFGSIQVKVFDQIKLEIETSAILIVTVSTELPGETPAVVMTQGFIGNGTRAWFTVELPAQTIGRDIRIQIGARGSWIFYRGSVSMRTTGRYLSAAPGQLDRLRTLEQDFGSERIKICKKLELDVSVSGGGVLGFLLYTDEPGGLGLRATLSVNDTGGARQTVRVNLPPNVRGRLWRIEAFPSGTINTTAFIYAIRAWMRTVGEAENGAWAWQTFALEESETLPRWPDLPVEPTADEWTWMPIPLAEPLPSAA